MSRRTENIILFILVIIGLIIVGLIIRYEKNNKEQYVDEPVVIKSNNKLINDEIKKEDKNNIVVNDTNNVNNTNTTNSTNISKNNNNTNSNYKIYDNSNNAKSVNETNTNSSNEVVEKTVPNNDSYYSDKDLKVISELESINNKTDNLLSSSNVDSALTKAKGVFISLVDFIFYDAEIKGVRFDELTDNGKKKVLSITANIDEKIDNKFPNYKRNIATNTSNAFLKASNLIRNGAANINAFSKEKLGEDNYNSLIEAKDELIVYTKNAFSIVGNIGSNLVSSASNKIKNWYESFRSN